MTFSKFRTLCYPLDKCAAPTFQSLTAASTTLYYIRVYMYISLYSQLFFRKISCKKCNCSCGMTIRAYKSSLASAAER